MLYDPSLINSGLLLKSVALVAGTNTIPHGLARIPLGWCVARVRTITAAPPVWTAATYTNNWRTYTGAAGYGAAAYRINPEGRVYLRGLVENGTIATDDTSAIFTLPAAYRPTETAQLFITKSAPNGLGIADIRVGSNGAVDVFGAGITGADANSTFVSLAGISFDSAAPPAQANGSNLPLWDTSDHDSTNLYLTAAAALTIDIWCF